MSKPRVSVALCTYNGARYLDEQLLSIAAQTRLPDELVVCDDGSTDNTLRQLEDFRRAAAFEVRVLHGIGRLGPAKNFERAIRESTGDVIILSDQDDIWHASKVARLSAALAGDPEALYAFSDAEMADEMGRPLGHTFWDATGLREKVDTFGAGEQLKVLANHNVIPGAALAFRARFRELLLPIPDGWMHDYWMVLLGSAVSHGVPVPETLFAYRRHANQVCGWNKKSRWRVWKDSLYMPPAEAWRKVEIFQALLGRLGSLATNDPAIVKAIAYLEQKQAHLRNRAQVRSSKGIRRVRDVIAEARTGRYQQFSGSWYSILRDL